MCERCTYVDDMRLKPTFIIVMRIFIAAAKKKEESTEKKAKFVDSVRFQSHKEIWRHVR